MTMCITSHACVTITSLLYYSISLGRVNDAKTRIIMTTVYDLRVIVVVVVIHPDMHCMPDEDDHSIIEPLRF